MCNEKCLFGLLEQKRNQNMLFESTMYTFISLTWLYVQSIDRISFYVHYNVHQLYQITQSMLQSLLKMSIHYPTCISRVLKTDPDCVQCKYVFLGG